MNTYIEQGCLCFITFSDSVVMLSHMLYAVTEWVILKSCLKRYKINYAVFGCVAFEVKIWITFSFIKFEYMVEFILLSTVDGRY